jgi:hypothetical protein
MTLEERADIIAARGNPSPRVPLSPSAWTRTIDKDPANLPRVPLYPNPRVQAQERLG